MAVYKCLPHISPWLGYTKFCQFFINRQQNTLSCIKSHCIDESTWSHYWVNTLHFINAKQAKANRNPSAVCMHCGFDFKAFQFIFKYSRFLKNIKKHVSLVRKLVWFYLIKRVVKIAAAFCLYFKSKQKSSLSWVLFN